MTISQTNTATLNRVWQKTLAGHTRGDWPYTSENLSISKKAFPFTTICRHLNFEKLPAHSATEAAPVSYVVAACAVCGVASPNVDVPIWFDKAVDPRFDGVFLAAVGV